MEDGAAATGLRIALWHHLPSSDPAARALLGDRYICALRLLMRVSPQDGQKEPQSSCALLDTAVHSREGCCAGASTWLVHLTGNPVYDAVGSITIGGLLGCTAIFLIQQNRSLLLGKQISHLHPRPLQMIFPCFPDVCM